MAALSDLIASQFKSSDTSAPPEKQDPPSVYLQREGGGDTMSEGPPKQGNFDEPFTLISSAADSFGSSVADRAGSRDLMGHFTSGKEWIASKHSKVQPWAVFFNPKNFSLPKGAGEVTSRLLGNLQRFQSNYLFVFLGLVVYCVITNPTLLLALGFCFAAWWFISVKNNSENVRLFGRDTSARELYLAVSIVCIPLFYLAGAGSAVFWIIGASVVLILLHAAMIAPPPSHRTVDEELGLVMEEVTIS